MADDRTELLRTQTVHQILQALGAAQVHAYGNDAAAGGVFLETTNTVTSVTYWSIGTNPVTRYAYTVRVTVDVDRREAPNGG